MTLDVQGFVVFPSGRFRKPTFGRVGAAAPPERAAGESRAAGTDWHAQGFRIDRYGIEARIRVLADQLYVPDRVCIVHRRPTVRVPESKTAPKLDACADERPRAESLSARDLPPAE
ncbi:MAG TPA: hypothetical protein VN153_09605 [Tahibacter sp.]|nr:hypothetical protein [Tahibacter sp.]